MAVAVPVLVLVVFWSIYCLIAVFSKDQGTREFVLKAGTRVEGIIGRIVGEAPKRQPTSSVPANRKHGTGPELAVVPELAAESTVEAAARPRTPRRRTPKSE
ncbi:hypothetical protein [Kribbella sp. NPDC049227]|uniref:hypothetical protein n=1 Tax=Kribbella sp. NPDC049227 TaxID=3364113 RepID=UPI0037240F2B